LDLETCSYTEYHQNVWRQLREIYQTAASSFDEVKAQCMPFPAKGVKVDKMFDWVIGEVITVLDTVWRMNDNFTVLGIESVIRMLNGEGCQEMGQLRDLVGSRDAMILENVPKYLHKLAGQNARRWWKPHGLPEALRKLETARAATASDSNN
jgi:hypothetical protein